MSGTAKVIMKYLEFVSFEEKHVTETYRSIRFSEWFAIVNIGHLSVHHISWFIKYRKRCTAI